VFLRGYGFLFSSEKKEELTTKRHEENHQTKEESFHSNYL
jgi:hypothetical protein